MATKQDALKEYNKQHRTNYATVNELGADIVKKLLREAWASSAYEKASMEEIV